MTTLLRSETWRQAILITSLLIVAVIFNVLTQGAFLSPRNILNLINQSAHIAILAVGMSLVLILRHIDLSVGFLAGFIGAACAALIQIAEWPSVLVLPLGLGGGLLGGLALGILVSWGGIPSLVASLAGWLLYRGLLGYLTSITGTIIIDDPLFTALANSHLPDLGIETSAFPFPVHFVSFILGLLFLLFTAFTRWRRRQTLERLGAIPEKRTLWLLRTGLLLGALGYLVWIFGTGGGLTWTLVLVLGTTVVFSYLGERTYFGRHIYAIGNDPVAARLAGLPVKRVTLTVFGIMGFLAALAGLVYASRLKSATPTAGTLFELDAIASAYIGGVSVRGGEGRVISSMIGVLFYASLVNGMGLLGIDPSLQSVIRAAVLLSAVSLDSWIRRYPAKEITHA